MTINSRVLKQAKEGMEYLKRFPERNAYIGMRPHDEHYIDFIVERDNIHFGNGPLVFTFWETSVYGFSFTEGLFTPTQEGQ